MEIKLEQINTLEDLKVAKNKIYSKNGPIFELQNKLKTASILEKKEIGRQINELKKEYDAFFKAAEDRVKHLEIQNKINKEFIDVSTPTHDYGSLHIITIVENLFRDWFNMHGYSEAVSGEIVSDLYNFEKLNIPSNHPARAMHDSLYLNATTLLRTHNTGISAEALEKVSNQEFATYSIGKVYRNDEDDATHSHQFTQLDFVAVGHVSFPNLIWTLKSLLSYVLEQEVEIRMRPSYFPFTEPSVEVDVLYNGKWIEILGAGMLHPNVLKLAGFTNDMNGFAAGIGIERVTMIKYGFTDIRDLYSNDLRILKQF